MLFGLAHLFLHLAMLDRIIHFNILLKTIHRDLNIVNLLKILFVQLQQRHSFPTLEPQLPMCIGHEILDLLVHVLFDCLFCGLLGPFDTVLFALVEVLPELVEFLYGLGAGGWGFGPVGVLEMLAQVFAEFCTIYFLNFFLT